MRFRVVQQARVLALLTLGVGSHAAPPPSLAVWARGERTVFWQADQAPVRWAAGDTTLARMAHWRSVRAGVEWAELELEGQNEARRTRLVAARIDPARVRFELVNGIAPGGGAPVWTVDRAPAEALVALNAGQFLGDGVWGWVVHDGVEYRAPRTGPLALAVTVGTDGMVRLSDDATVAGWREAGPPGRPRGVVEGFQSYPALLTGDGVVPDFSGLDLGHRDARIALGVDGAGRVIVAVTRFDVLPGLDMLPFGLTVPEMAAVMGSLGSDIAVALDGGISAQLALGDGAGHRQLWPGLRAVPLGLVILP